MAARGARECQSNKNNNGLGPHLVTEEINRFPRACLRNGHDVVTGVGGGLDHHLLRGEARGAVRVRGCESVHVWICECESVLLKSLSRLNVWSVTVAIGQHLSWYLFECA